MEGSQFDALSRRLGRSRSRRGALKAIAGAVIAGMTGAQAASAQSCTAHYAPCGGDEECCAGSVCQYGLCMPGCRIDGAFVNASMSPSDNICATCAPEVSTTAWTPANDGMSCWSGDPTAGATVCQNGTCAPTGPAQCPPPPPCHTDQLIDPGSCTYAVAEAGTPCGGQAMCHGGFYTPADTCDGNRFCIGGGSQTVSCAPYTCGDGACRTTCDSDHDCVGGAGCCNGACMVLDTIENCGACGNGCPEPANSTAICMAGTCGYSCDPGFEPDGAGGCAPVACTATGPCLTTTTFCAERYCDLFGRLACQCHDTDAGTTVCVNTCISRDDGTACATDADCAAIPGAMCLPTCSAGLICQVPCEADYPVTFTASSRREAVDPFA